jgi:hypothetical protein
MNRWFLFALVPWVYGFGSSDPAWLAADRLDARRGVPRAGTLWLSGDLTSWDALPGALSSRVALGCEPRSGPGLRVAYRTLNWADGSMKDFEGALIWRRPAWRGECAFARTYAETQHATRCSPRFLIAVSPHLVAGGSLTVFPESPRASPDFEVEAHSAAGPWLLGLVLHENASEAAVGIQARSGLAVIARYANDVPSIGVIIDAHRVELRAEALDHPLLGRVARVTVRWMGGRR